MRTLVRTVASSHTPESLAARLLGEPGLVLLRTGLFEQPIARYSFLTACPFLTFRSSGPYCEIRESHRSRVAFGNPWHLLETLLGRYELADEVDLPFPLGGCFGIWGYDLKNHLEPKLRRRAPVELDLPDCHLGFYDSLVVFDHQLNQVIIVSTGLTANGERSQGTATERCDFWLGHLESPPAVEPTAPGLFKAKPGATPHLLESNLPRTQFLERVQRALDFIRAGDIYQVNLAQRFSAAYPHSAWDLFRNLTSVSPAPFSAFLDAGDFQLASTSPELFLRVSGTHVVTRPIKGTRPRGQDASNDARLSYELQTSAKEAAELVMITDLLRNDLGKMCEFGSVRVPDLMRLERYPLVQHLVSTVEGRLRPGLTHLSALASCFPGGSVTGAPKFRAMEIIDELEPSTRGPYTGALGYLGFNRESQLSIVIRTALCQNRRASFYAGSGLVADSDPEAEYEETLHKAAGFFRAIGCASTAKRTANI